ncbi:MAG: DUF5666 domain-containing protein [bacterium]|nr:hypothetical protein [Gammaproteobacteria bacterium]
MSVDTNINGNILVVLGQTVFTDEGTVFDEIPNSQSLAGLSVGDVIEVSGLLNSNGQIVATYMEKRPPGGEFELVGIVSNLDVTESRFDLGDQLIEFSGAELKDFNSALTNGDQVEVKGESFNSDGELVAMIVELKKISHATDDNVELEGLVTHFESATDFDVFGTSVSTTTGADFLRGTVDDLAINVKLEVEGKINTDGVLIQTK